MTASEIESHIESIDRVLPQTQCRQCGFDGCHPYAQAIAARSADINRCPPGGSVTIARLAHLTGLPIRTLDPACGVERPRTVAWIDPELCIGCTKCIDACPVDAIIGAAKWLHAVINEHCTGCELCLSPCPVDCIELRECDPQAWTEVDAQRSRRRYVARGARLARFRVRDDRQPATGAPPKPASPAEIATAADLRKRAIIDAAVKRAGTRLESERLKRRVRGAPDS